MGFRALEVTFLTLLFSISFLDLTLNNWYFLYKYSLELGSFEVTTDWISFQLNSNRFVFQLTYSYR